MKYLEKCQTVLIMKRNEDFNENISYTTYMTLQDKNFRSNKSSISMTITKEPYISVMGTESNNGR